MFWASYYHIENVLGIILSYSKYAEVSLACKLVNALNIVMLRDAQIALKSFLSKNPSDSQVFGLDICKQLFALAACNQIN